MQYFLSYLKGYYNDSILEFHTSVATDFATRDPEQVKLNRNVLK